MRNIILVLILLIPSLSLASDFPACFDQDQLIKRREVMVLSDQVEAYKQAKRLKSTVAETKGDDGRKWFVVRYEIIVPTNNAQGCGKS